MARLDAGEWPRVIVTRDRTGAMVYGIARTKAEMDRKVARIQDIAAGTDAVSFARITDKDYLVVFVDGSYIAAVVLTRTEIEDLYVNAFVATETR